MVCFYGRCALIRGILANISNKFLPTNIFSQLHSTAQEISSNNTTQNSFKNQTEEKSSKNVGFVGMLKNFINSAKRNSVRPKQGYRHDGITKMFAGFMKMVGGLLSYETLHANFPVSLPSISTVDRFIADRGPQIAEGEMRTVELVEYLRSRNLRLQVSLSEDATRITAKICYDSKTNQLVGFALPLDVNGMPVLSSFPARNVREIQHHFTNPSNVVSSTAYVQMAQPTEPNTTPFCLMMYSTDNKFTACNVYKRWKFQAKELREKGVGIYNIASDGDSRPLMAMKVFSRLGQQDLSYIDCEWYSCGSYAETTFTQDYVHIITKMRNRILSYSRIFPIGNRIISFSHLKYLIDHLSKDKHLLTNTDIEPKDRQNFPSAEKLCSENTIKCLLEHVPGSEGTAAYLKVMRNVLNAFQKTDATSEERIYSIWYACFFCRAWRSWILNSEKSKMSAKNRPKSFYNLKENFVSSNCQTCIELNAHSLVKKVLDEDRDEETSSNDNTETVDSRKRKIYFFSALFDSQVCEYIFRQVRSFTSTFCTIVNFNMCEIINRIRKVQLQNEIINISQGEIKFPRFEKKTAPKGNQQLINFLNREAIISIIDRAKNDVVFELENLEVDTSQLNFRCQIQPAYEENIVANSDVDCDCSSDSEDFEIRKENEHHGADQHNLSDDEDDDEFREDINFLSGTFFIWECRNNVCVQVKENA